MSALGPRVHVPRSFRAITARRLRVLAILLFVVGAQLAPLSFRLPFGGDGILPAHAAATPAITSVAFDNASYPPTVTVVGNNFGAQPSPYGTQPNGAYLCGSPTGSNYAYRQYGFADTTVPWNAGQSDPTGGTVANCIGIIFSSYSATQVAFTFGSGYGGNGVLSGGDRFTVYVAGLACSGTVVFNTPTTCGPPTTISTVAFGGSSANPTITVNGSGFGSSLPGPTVTAPAGYTGTDYICGVLAMSFSGLDVGQAGPVPASYVCPSDGAVHYDYLGLTNISYSDAQVQFTLGSYYAGQLSAGTPFSVTVAGATCSGTVSYTGAVYCQNSTWGAAQLLSQTTGSYELNQTVSQPIYGPVTERWYRFQVTPGSSVHVQYSGLPGAVVSLHSDLQSQYNALTNPTSAALESARNGGSGFLPQSFLPQSFLPQSFLPGPYSSAPYSSLLAVSASPNSNVQTIDHDTWNTFGYMYVRVAAPPSLSKSFTLTVTEAGGVCAGVSTLTVTPPAAIPSGLSTLILWDPSRIDGSSADVSTLTTKLGQLAARSEVHGAVVDLSGISGLDGAGSAQQQADNYRACPTAKNIVANGIKRVVQAYRAQNAGLRYVVLVGDDRSIPFFRYPDESGLGLENQYSPPVADASASDASLRNNYILGQDEYGASLAVPLGIASLPIPDLAVGRLVKTAAEVSHMLDVYTAANGMITPSSSLVTGYDFVADAANTATSELQGGTSTAPDTLITPQGTTLSAGWTASDLRQKLFGSRHDVVFLAGHFSAGGLEAADYATALSASEVASSSVDLSNSLILALGCHSGYDIPASDAVASLSPAPDWPEAMAMKGATFLSSTGYAYGDTVLAEYGEHLFDNYLRQLRSYSGAGYTPVAVGQAAVAAKKEYLASHTTLTGVDQKTLLETTLYGLPMLQVNMTGQHIGPPADPSIVASAPPVVSGPGQPFGLGASEIDVQPILTPHTVQLGTTGTTYLTGPNNGVVARPGEPIFPSQFFNVHVASQILRGVGFRGGTYSDTAHIIPLTSAVGTETSVGHPAFYSTVFYPTQTWSSNFFDAIGGGSERLVTTPAQYMSTSAASTDGTLRQFSAMRFRLFYLPANWPSTPNSPTVVAAAPAIGDVSATASAGTVSFGVHVTSDQTAGVQSVWVTYTDPSSPGTWQSIDLSPGGSDPTLWTATQSLPSGIVFMVQAASGTGLVTLSTNAGALYRIGAPPASTTATTLALQGSPASGAYLSTSGTFTVQLLAANGTPLPAGQLVTLQLGSQQALATTGTDGRVTATVPLNQPPGSYPVIATFAGATASGTTYLASSSAVGTFTITPAPTSLALAPAPSASVRYGDTASFTATLTDSTGAAMVQRTVVFFVTGNGRSVTRTAITDYNGRAALDLAQLPTGTYSVSAAFGGTDHTVTISVGGSTATLADPKYLTSNAGPTTLTITPAPLTITASSASSVYGGTVPPITPGYSGFVNGDSGAVVSGVSCAAGAASSSPVGSYPTTCLGGVAANYAISYQPGTLTIGPAPLTVTASSATMTYLGPMPAITPAFTGLVANDTPASELAKVTCATAATPSSPVGKYPTSCTLNDPNYSPTYVAGTLAIHYRFDGFLQPINDTGHTQTCASPCPMSVFKAGSTVPVKFVLKDAAGNVLVPKAGATMPQWLVPENLGTTSNPIDESTYTDVPTPGTAFTWDGSQYRFNWKTASGQAGHIWRIGAILDDGEVVTVTIGLR